MKIKRYLYITHRWLGIMMCLFFAMWFFSGVVMMYVGFPELSEKERLVSLPEIHHESISVPVLDLIEDMPVSAIASLKLTTVAGRPMYLLTKVSGETRSMYADNGESPELAASTAIRSARQFIENNPSLIIKGQVAYHGLLDMDQWTVSRSLNSHRPLHWLSLNDESDTHVYVSSITGEVVRDVSRQERFWNWLGANLHWIYPFQLRRHSELWSNIVITLSLIGCVSLITGATVGIIRLRLRNPYRGQTVTPYRGFMKLHHVLGLCALLFLSTYTFSGLMSMNPWDIFSSADNRDQQLLRYQHGHGAALDNALAFDNAESLSALLASAPAKELSWHWLNGNSYVVIKDENLNVDALKRNQVAIQKNDILSAIAGLIPQAKVQDIELLQTYDSYYYSHHERNRPLPALRVKFNDKDTTWFHIDLNTAEIINQLNDKERWQRWLYNGMHSLDFNFLILNRPLWDIIVIALCTAGMLFSLTSVVIGYRRLTFKLKKMPLRQ